MKAPLTSDLPMSAYNAEVRKVYFRILKDAKALLATIEAEPLRYSLIREDKPPIVSGSIVHEFISPLLYLRLALYEDKLCIHFGWELTPAFGEFYPITSTFIRNLYKATMVTVTSINIEDCIRTDYIINECSAAYEHLEERGCRHHSFQLIPYKAKAVKRKLRKVA